MTSSSDDQSFSLSAHGLTPKRVRANLGTAELYEHAARRGEGTLTDRGAMAVVTSPHTGRSPKDKFVVEESGSADKIWWDKNARLSEAHFERSMPMSGPTSTSSPRSSSRTSTAAPTPPTGSRCGS